MKRIHGFMMCLFALSATMFCAAALSQSMPATELRVALKGYDPVAYFTEQKPVKGNSAPWRWIFDRPVRLPPRPPLL